MVDLLYYTLFESIYDPIKIVLCRSTQAALPTDYSSEQPQQKRVEVLRV